MLVDDPRVLLEEDLPQTLEDGELNVEENVAENALHLVADDEAQRP